MGRLPTEKEIIKAENIFEKASKGKKVSKIMLDRAQKIYEAIFGRDDD